MSCTALVRIHLPATLQTMGAAYPGDVFENTGVLGCNHLEAVTVTEGSAYFSSQDGLLYNADGTKYNPVRTPASKPTTTVKAVAKPQPAPQMTLFDFMEKEDGETTATDVENTGENEPENEEEDDLPSADEIDEILAEIDGEDGARKYPENVDMETGEILPAKAEKSESSVSPYEPEALRILQGIFGDEMVLR